MVQACWLPCCLMPCFKRDRKTVDVILFSYQCPSCVPGTGYPQEAQKRWHLAKHPFCSFSWACLIFFLNSQKKLREHQEMNTALLSASIPVAICIAQWQLHLLLPWRQGTVQIHRLLVIVKSPTTTLMEVFLECWLLLSTTGANVSEYWFIRN